MESNQSLRPGMKISLERGKVTGKTTLRGWKPGRYLLVDIPGPLWTSLDSAPIICRLVGVGKYFGFTTVCRAALREFNLLILDFPKDIVDMSYRKSERYNVALPVMAGREASDDNNASKGVVTDISCDGCQLTSKIRIKKGDRFFIRAGFPTSSGMDNIPCVARNVAEEGDRFCYGVEFDCFEDEIEPVKRFLEQISAFYPEGAR